MDGKNILSEEILNKCGRDFHRIRPGFPVRWEMPENIWTMENVRGAGDAVLNQHRTGYCWLGGFLNCLERLSKNQKIPWEWPSVDSLIFYDKLEKASWFLNRFLERDTAPICSRETQYLLERCGSDQGNWRMAAGLVQKYGLVPAQDGETQKLRDTGGLNHCLRLYLRTNACRLRKIQEKKGAEPDELHGITREVMSGVYVILAEALGEPPKGRPPGAYAEDMLVNYCSISCIPAYPEHTILSIPLDGNIEEMGGNVFVNLSEEEFFRAVGRQTVEEGFCYIGCDSGQFANHKSGIWDESCFSLPSWLGKEEFMRLGRRDLFNYRMVSISHAVMLCGRISATDGDWWMARNTLGADYGFQGYAAVSEGWLKRYTAIAAVRPTLLERTIDTYPLIEIKPWELYRGEA